MMMRASANCSSLAPAAMIFEGYSESGDKKSNLVVENYAFVKEAREALF